MTAVNPPSAQRFAVRGLAFRGRVAGAAGSAIGSTPSSISDSGTTAVRAYEVQSTDYRLKERYEKQFGKPDSPKR